MVYERLMNVFFFLDLQEASSRRSWDIIAHLEKVFLMFSDHRTSFL